MENIHTGLLLMVVGMTTVFVILLLVINLGKSLIFLVNKFAPEEVVVKKQNKRSPGITSAGGISPEIVAAVTGAIGVSSNGNGKVVKIEKI